MAALLYMLMEVIRFITKVTRPLSDHVLTFFYRLRFGNTKELPPINNGILIMPAVELAEKIRKKQLSCEEVMSAYVERSKAVHPMINAAVDERYDAALEDARQVDQFLARNEKSEEDIARDTPLLGVPFTCKEAIGIKGLAQTCGLWLHRKRKAPGDSVTASMYRKAGAIPVIVTNVPEFCMWWESANQHFGMTLNPYDNVRSVGGSSGGEGAAITSAAALFGIGNDIAGSIRIPASFCGIYGHKASVGVISNKGHYPEDDEVDMYVSTGPMCRYAVDLPLLTKICSGYNTTVPWDTKVDFRKVKFYYMEEIPSFMQSADTDIKNAIKKAARHFEDEYGVTATKFSMDEMRYAFNIWESKLLETDVPPFKAAIAGPTGKLNLWWELFKCFFRCSEHTFPALYFAMVDRREKDTYYYECLEKFKVLKRKFDEIMEGDAVLLFPTQLEPPPHYLMTIPKYPNVGYTCIFSILGYASTQIPAGLSNGLPIGIQAISRQKQDHLTLAVGVELDKVFKGWISPCPILV